MLISKVFYNDKYKGMETSIDTVINYDKLTLIIDNNWDPLIH